ncbi:hypothetical protein LJ655_23595 [Paraburkholderia sp. MMS20-SJTN17]|uniref:Uncharacterized protein n=1 Tax=Paraburkholderia translucens TaxID=2886945 RepID=A0ABS8KJ69_9BURK|nr:hypothetical protein [Paraburkholderia sp. MMS20-SJTN17]MCC8404821.1 hypothetical protein [Paraburkholderia sp. MMS20-SJTN17]
MHGGLRVEVPGGAQVRGQALEGAMKRIACKGTLRIGAKHGLAGSVAEKRSGAHFALAMPHGYIRLQTGVD